MADTAGETPARESDRSIPIPLRRDDQSRLRSTMSGLSNFLGNVYGENEEPEDPSDVIPESEDDQLSESSLDDVRNSMEELLDSAEASAAEPVEATDGDWFAGIDHPSAGGADTGTDSWYSEIDSHPTATPPADASSSTSQLDEDPEPATNEGVDHAAELAAVFETMDEPGDTKSAPTSASDDSPEPTDPFSADESPEEQDPPDSSWFDHLEDARPEPDDETFQLSDVENKQELETWDSATPDVVPQPSAQEEPAVAIDPVDPLAVPAPPEPLVTDDDFLKFDPPEEATQDPDPWLDEILSDDSATVAPAPADANMESDTPDPPASVPQPQVLQPAPQQSTLPAGSWDPSYDDIIPGKVTAAAAVRATPMADQAVAAAIDTAAERRRPRRGRRAVDDAHNPVLEPKSKTRRRARRRDVDTPSVDAPVTTVDAEDGQQTEFPPETDPVLLPPPSAETPPTADPVPLTPPVDLPAPETDPVEAAESENTEPEKNKKDRRRGLLGRRSADDARNMVHPDSDALRSKGRRRKIRRYSDSDITDRSADMSDMTAAEIMGLGPEMPHPSSALDLPAPPPSEPAVIDLPAPEGPPVDLPTTPPLDDEAPEPKRRSFRRRKG